MDGERISLTQKGRSFDKNSTKCICSVQPERIDAGSVQKKNLHLINVLMIIFITVYDSNEVYD